MNGPITREMPNIAEKPTVKNHYIREAFQRYARKNWKLGAELLFSIAVLASIGVYMLREGKPSQSSKSPIKPSVSIGTSQKEHMKYEIPEILKDPFPCGIGVVRANWPASEIPSSKTKKSTGLALKE
ncbi:MAG: hypothetical protein ABIH99_02365 [Candidatus Micrarchaeota archaeon]